MDTEIRRDEDLRRVGLNTNLESFRLMPKYFDGEFEIGWDEDLRRVGLNTNLESFRLMPKYFDGEFELLRRSFLSLPELQRF